MLEVHGIPVQGGETGILESIISVLILRVRLNFEASAKRALYGC